jgi:hypothetical protein
MIGDITMNKLKKCTAMILVLIMALSCFVYGNAIKAQAASTQFSISLSSSSVSKGGSVTVTVSVSCSEALGAYSYCLSYDSSVLEYTSGDGYGGGGTISCAGYGDGNIKSASNSFTFSAIASGSSYVGTGSSDVYTWGEESCSVSNAGATITVTAAGSGNNGGDSTTQAATTQEQGSTEAGSTESGESTESTEETSEETTEEMSDNCFLSSLQITPGELKPEFSKDVYSYETTVPGETTSLAINALPEDSKSSVSIDGNENFEPGKQAHVTIKVTAETGDTHIYDLTVNVEEIVDTRAVINVNGTDYYFSQDYSKISVPEGFAQSKEKFDGTDVILYTSPNGQIKCAYLTDKDGKNGAWYIIDLNAKTAVPLINVQSAYKNFIILEPYDNVSMPEGYSSFSYDFGGNTVTAYHVTENDEVILVYAMSPDSDPSWYRYDTVEKTFVRYNADPVTEKQEETASDGSFFDQHKDKVLTICIIVVVVMFFLIIILACMLVRVIRKGLPEDDEPDDPNDPDKMTDEDIDTDAIDDADDNIEADATDDAGDSVESDATDDTDDNIEADTTDDADDANVDSKTSETSSVTDVADNSEIVDDSAKADTIDDTADSDSSEDSEQLVLNESSDKDSIEASSIPEIKAKTEPAEADTTDLQATTEEAVATDTTEAEQPEPDANASVKETAAATHDGMTELKAEPATKAENITSTRLSAGAKKKQELTPAEEIVKKAAKYSSMNTADLSEVFNMAEAIINHEDPKKNAGSLQFKPIKQNAPEDKKEK